MADLSPEDVCPRRAVRPPVRFEDYKTYFPSLASSHPDAMEGTVLSQEGFAEMTALQPRSPTDSYLLTD